MSTAARPLLAARGSPGDISKDSGSNSPSGPHRSPAGSDRPKRTLIESACQACRRRKSKCDGQRPNCSRCQSLRSECIYEAEEGESRWSALKRRNTQLEAEIQAVRDLLDWIRTSPESDALTIFERMRSIPTENVFNLLNTIRNERGSVAGVAAGLPFPSGENRLPPINSILVTPVPSARTTPAALIHHNSSLSSEESQTSSVSDLVMAPRGRMRGPPDTLEPSLVPTFGRSGVPSLSSEESSNSLGYSAPLNIGPHGMVPPILGSEDSVSAVHYARAPPHVPPSMMGPTPSDEGMHGNISFPIPKRPRPH